MNQALSQWQTTLSIIMMVVSNSAGGLTSHDSGRGWSKLNLDLASACELAPMLAGKSLNTEAPRIRVFGWRPNPTALRQWHRG